MDVTAKQAALLLGVTSRSIARYITSGKLKARRFGLKAHLINLDVLRKFASENNAVFNEILAQQLEQQQN